MNRTTLPTLALLAVALLGLVVAGVASRAPCADVVLLAPSTDAPAIAPDGSSAPPAAHRDDVVSSRLAAEPAAAPDADALATPRRDRVVNGPLADPPAGVSPADLVAGPARPLPDGALTEISQRHHGLPVLGASAAVRTAADGRVLWSRSSLRAIPDDLSLIPRTTADEALVAAGVTGAAAAGAHAELVVWALSSTPRLAWLLRLPIDRRRLELWEIAVDATTGDPLARRNLARSAGGHLARIYPDNPVATPDLAEVTLDRLAPGATRLVDPDMDATSCVDLGHCEVFLDVAYHACTEGPIVSVGADGDFLGVTVPEDPLDPDDPFAELSAYAHAAKAIAFFRTLAGPAGLCGGATWWGGPTPRGRGGRGAAGAPPPGSTVTPMDNAMFLPPDPTTGSGPQAYFGQGAIADFALDGDVVYHELAHGLVFTLAPQLGWTAYHPHGIDTTPAGLVEGLPDFLAAALSGSSKIGEYIDAMAVESEVAMPILDRDLATPRRCPEDLVGMPHDDGRIVASALWAIRVGLAEEQRADFDRAVVTAIDALDASSGFETFGAAVGAEVEATLGGGAAAEARAVLAEHGVDACDGLVRTLGPDERHDYLVVGNVVDFTVMPAAPLQFRVELEAEAASLAVTFATTTSAFDVAVKPGDAPIEWTDDVMEPGLRVETIVGDFGPEGQGPYEVLVRGPFPAGVYHLQLLAPIIDESTISIADITGIGVAPSDRVPPDPDPGADAGPDDEDEDVGDDDGGGCAVAPGVHSTGTLFLLAVVAMLARGRRRSRGRRHRRGAGA